MAVGAVQTGYENQVYSYSAKAKTQAEGFESEMTSVAKSGNSNEKKEFEIDFSRFAPHAPEKVKQAFMEAANETGYDVTGKMNHISQILVIQVENRHNGVSNPQDVFGNSVTSALQAARQMLYDLENPLVPVSQRGENAAKYVEEEKEFYRAFIEKLENMSVANPSYVNKPEMSNANEEFNKEEAMQLIAEHREELYEKLKNNDTEESFQIGGTSFTLKEWEKLLEEFDSVQEEIRKQMAEEQAKRQEYSTSTAEVEETTSVTAKDSTDIAKTAGVTQTNPIAGVTETEETEDNSVVESLTAESTTFTYSSSEEGEPDKKYITWYTEEGIYCREEGQTTGYHFRMTFDDESQYEKVMDFLDRVPEKVNMRFAGNRYFWEKLLAGEVNEEGFLNFLEEHPDGYTLEDITYDNNGSLFFDREKTEYATYLNPFMGNMVYKKEDIEEFTADLMLREFGQNPYARNAKETMFDHCAEGVKEAWERAQKTAGVDAVGINDDGTLSYISEFMKQWQIRFNRADDYMDILGSTIESALAYAKEALHSIQNPVVRETNMSYAKSKEKEEIFYQQFIENLEYYQKHGKL